MAFRPFGYRFELTSMLPLCEARTNLNERLVGWFATNEAPRGWTVGPLCCLWLSAFDRFGPMVFALITGDGRGTRVRGLAGSDLNGVLWFSVLFGLFAFAVASMLADGSGTPTQVWIFGPLMLAGAGAVYWSAHADRRQAEPLIAFLEDVLGKERRMPRVRLAEADSVRPMMLSHGNLEGEVPATEAAVREAIEAMRYDRYARLVLAIDDQHYIQSAAQDGGFVLERRDGGEEAHFSAEHRDGTGALFSLDEIAAAVLGYLAGRADSPGVRWVAMRL